MFEVDPEKTQERYEKLESLYLKKGLNADEFNCKFFEECKLSQNKCNIIKQYAGGTAAISPFYDISYDGIPMRTMIIGKETGYMKNTEFGTSPNFYKNCDNVLNCINWEKKNNHIKGTLLTLQYIFQVKTEYIYASYALSNILRCAFQDSAKSDNVSAVRDTAIMRRNCIHYLFDEIDILEPNLIICQGEWAIKGKEPFVEKVAKHYDIEVKCLRKNSNDKYGLYNVGDFYIITCHHPAILGNWIKNLAPDSLWPSLDYLRENGILPLIDKTCATEQYENLVKNKVDKIIETLDSNDLLRK